MRVGREDEERDNCLGGAALAHQVVQLGQRLYEHIDTFVFIFVSASGEHVEGVVQREVHVSVEVALDECVDLGLGDVMEVLEFVLRRHLYREVLSGRDTATHGALTHL